MNWDQVIANVIVPVGMAIFLGGGGILVVKMMVRRLSKDLER